jgi:hypothetical protein
MNTKELSQITWGEEELRGLVTEFVRQYGRTPSLSDLEQFRWEREVTGNRSVELASGPR